MSRSESKESRTPDPARAALARVLALGDALQRAATPGALPAVPDVIDAGRDDRNAETDIEPHGD
jgi:hypothetical protein